MDKHTVLMKEWRGYCEQFPEVDYDQPSAEEVNATISEFGETWFRLSTAEDFDPNYMAADDFTAGEWVWLGDEEHVVTQGCAENWSLQGTREKDVCSYTFSDIAKQFVLETVADQLRAYNANQL